MFRKLFSRLFLRVCIKIGLRATEFFFEIPALLSCEQGNPKQENSKNILYFEFSHSRFPRLQDKRA